MIWRHGCNIFRIAPCKILRTFAHQPHRKCSAPLINLTKNLHNQLNEDMEQKFSENRQVILTNELVHTTLLNCSSDLVTLSFFMWCAKQPNFFHNTTAFEYMVGVVSRLMKRYETVSGILSGLESVGIVTKAQTFLLLLRIYWRGGMYELVFEAFDHMDRRGFTPNTFARNVIMDVLFKVGRADVALKVFKETLLPNFLTFNIVLCNLSKIRDLIGIRDAFRCMLRMGYYPNPGTFEVVLNDLCKLGRLVEAYQVLGIMTTIGISMSVNIWTIMIDGFRRLHRTADASSLVKKMEKSGCSPNIVTYTTLIKGYMDAQLVSDAFDVLSIIELEGLSPDRVLYNVLIDGLAKIGRYDEALCIFLSMDKQNILPDCYTFSSLLNTICLSKRVFLLPKLVDGFFADVDLVACNSLLSYLAKAGFPSLALELYDEMLDKGLMPDKYSVLGVLTGLCQAKRIDEAVNLYNGILLNYTGVDAHIHTVIINGLIKAGKCHSAIRVFRKNLLGRSSLDAVSYSVAIRGLLMVGRGTEACNLYNYMKEAGINPNGDMCNVMLSSFCKEKDLESVKQMLQEMIDLGIEISWNNFCRLCNAIYSSSYNFYLVSHLLVEMKGLGLLPDKLACKTLVYKRLKAVNISEEHHKLLNGHLEYCLFGDTSSS
ncbi:putative pentatricopeptide repeat-containing protein At1g16830 [Cucurbita pepo subsp. pepo]|uniref:putative pentatricopeptide repeat-containing protein At1g16830 n=1 Tax=Cucurbita pepo subsp. pepo TaxID=3664 RepID=UPI000C9D65D2|nr:putative pentatricopeptide repeat-containing protein At1g16830 [Cucurbita pepo subsp. pepo]XP_023519014.1 putative pentatricopeptide repeat-containing protein At1g16830 [Cucurbita pepo subsp. pepo]XP_023519015.1 putative pentatricopeptide repeat-containing protein At1g16830 [Cucurbita pepo subsp. pepo]